MIYHDSENNVYRTRKKVYKFSKYNITSSTLADRACHLTMSGAKMAVNNTDWTNETMTMAFHSMRQADDVMESLVAQGHNRKMVRKPKGGIYNYLVLYMNWVYGSFGGVVQICLQTAF